MELVLIEKEKIMVNNFHSLYFSGALTVAFIALKLFGLLSWPWVLVFSPLLVGTVLWLIFIVGLINLIRWIKK